jgi:hypothetical protein
MNFGQGGLARRRTIPVALIAAGALTYATLAFAAPDAQHRHASGDDHHAVAAHAGKAHAMTARQAAFHDTMRKLWEDHITWTRLAIVSFAEGLNDLPATQARLLANQDHIGNAIKPYYGHAAGERLTKLLKEHITGAVALLQAAKSGDDDAISAAAKAWYRNGDQVADFLHAANPDEWSRKAMRKMMKTHLDQTLLEAQHRLGHRYAQEIRVYDQIHRHILAMADALSDGIMHEVPSRFR